MKGVKLPSSGSWQCSCVTRWGQGQQGAPKTELRIICVKCVCIFIFYHLFQRNDDIRYLNAVHSTKSLASLQQLSIWTNFATQFFDVFGPLAPSTDPFRWLQHGEFLAALKGRHIRRCLLFFHIWYLPRVGEDSILGNIFAIGLKSWPKIEVYIRLRTELHWFRMVHKQTCIFVLHVYIYIHIYIDTISRLA